MPATARCNVGTHYDDFALSAYARRCRLDDDRFDDTDAHNNMPLRRRRRRARFFSAFDIIQHMTLRSRADMRAERAPHAASAPRCNFDACHTAILDDLPRHYAMQRERDDIERQTQPAPPSRHKRAARESFMLACCRALRQSRAAAEISQIPAGRAARRPEATT